MLGYIKSDIYEMKHKDSILYKKLYCSLCNELNSNFGTISRFFTSYDAIFFLAVFDGLDSKKQTTKIKCPLNPFLKKVDFLISQNALDYISLISLYYAISKIEDNCIDEKKFIYKLLKNRINKNKKVKNALLKNEFIVIKLKKILDEYYKMENNPINHTFDEFSNKMGELFGTVFSEFITYSNLDCPKEILYSFGFSIGKWIYIVDAFDDLKIDIKKNHFNPILYMDGCEDNINYISICNKILFMHNMLTKSVLTELRKLNLARNFGVVYNIVRFGMTKSILNIANFRYSFDILTEKGEQIAESYKR